MSVDRSPRPAPAQRTALLPRWSPRSAGLFAVLTLLALGGNYFGIPLYFGVDLLFGSVAVMLALVLLGVGPGTLVALIGSTSTYPLWDHPYAIVIFTLEALVVGLLARRLKGNLILADGAYWLFVGIPLVWVFYSGAMGMDGVAVKLIMGKQSVNGLLNAFIATLLLSHTPVSRLRGQGRRDTVPCHQMLLNLLSAFVLVPGLLWTVLAGLHELEESSVLAGNALKESAAFVTNRFRSGLTDPTEVLEAVGRVFLTLGGRAGERFGPIAPSYGELIPSGFAIFVADARGNILFSSPGALDDHVRDGLLAGDQGLSDLEVEDPEAGPHVHQVTPVRVNGRLAGYAGMILKPEFFARQIETATESSSARAAVLDGRGRVVASNWEGAVPAQPFRLRDNELVRPTTDGLYRWLPPLPDQPEMVRWRRSYYVTEQPLSERTSWRIVTAYPAAKYIDLARIDIANKLVITFAVLLLSLIAASVVSGHFSGAFKMLILVTADLARILTNGREVNWPRSSIQEFNTLIENFQSMTCGFGEKVRETERIANDLSRLIETANAPILGVDTEGRINEWNRKAAEITGYGKDEVLGRDAIESFVVDDNKAAVRKVLEAALKGKDTANFEVAVHTKDGRRVEMLLNATTRRDAAGNIVGAIGVGQEITKRKQAEQALRRSEASLANAQRIARLGSWDWNIVTNELSWSDETYRIFGLKPHQFEATYEAFLEAVHPDDRALVQEAVDQALHGKRRYSLDHRIVLPNGRNKTVHEQAEVEFDDSGKPIRMSGTIQDITERKRAEEEKANLERHLRQAQKMEALGLLAGGIAHDFNNMLTPILGLTKLTIEDLPSDHPGRANLEKVLEAGSRAKSLVQQILTFSRVRETERHPLALHTVVEEAVRLLRSTMAPTIEIRQEIDRNAGLVVAEPTEIHQVVMNLAANAAHAMDNRGVFEIALERVTLSEGGPLPDPSLKPGPYVRLRVRDTGCGMDKRTQRRIFDPFFTTKPVGEGTGMGLAVVHGIVTGYGGAVTVSSVRGKGTTFSCYFPVWDGEEAAGEARADRKHRSKPRRAVPRGNPEVASGR